jgi:hypothetical protein
MIFPCTPGSASSRGNGWCGHSDDPFLPTVVIVDVIGEPEWPFSVINQDVIEEAKDS